MERCLANCASLTELFRRFWNQIYQIKNIHDASQASQTKTFIIRFSYLNTKQVLYFLNWYFLGTTLTVFDMLPDFRFSSSGVNIKAAYVEQEAAPAVASVDT